MRKHYDFSKAKRANEVPHLKKFKAQNSGKTRITIMLDNNVLGEFREQAETTGIGYQTLINQTLKETLINKNHSTENPLTEKSLRKILREELRLK